LIRVRVRVQLVQLILQSRLKATPLNYISTRTINIFIINIGFFVIVQQAILCVDSDLRNLEHITAIAKISSCLKFTKEKFTSKFDLRKTHY